MMNVGILGYGTYIPRYRIKTSEIAGVWGKQSQNIERSLGISEKSVAAPDEDAVTLAFESATAALRHAQIPASDIELCLVGSESHPYAVNPTATIVAEYLGVGNRYLAADLEFACKAATAGIIAAAGLISSGQMRIALVIGSDTAQAAPHDVLEYTAGSAAAAYLLGPAEKSIVELVDTTSFSSDTPDFWRRDGVRFPSHGGRFTGEPSYFAHVTGAAKLLLEKTGRTASDFTYCVFHSPNGKFPQDAAKRLGFTSKQLMPSFLVSRIGNPYSASSLLGLAAVLDVAKPGETIFMVSYGSGAGSDAFVWEVKQQIKTKQPKKPLLDRLDTGTKHLSYVEYLRYTKKI